MDGTTRAGRSLAIGTLGDPTIGAWFRVSDNTDVGVEVAAEILSLGDDETDQTTWQVEVRPAFKHFVPRRGAFLPYTYGDLFYARGETTLEADGFEDVEADAWAAGGSLGVGMDWFAGRRITIGGHAGLRASFMEAGVDDLEEQDGWALGTFNSGVRVHLYI